MFAYRLMVLGSRAWGGKDASPPPPQIFLFPLSFSFPPNKNALHFCKAFRDSHYRFGGFKFVFAGSVHPAFMNSCHGSDQLFMIGTALPQYVSASETQPFVLSILRTPKMIPHLNGRPSQADHETL